MSPTIPENVLWQYLEKEHLDSENELTEKEWNDFVETHQSAFTSECSIQGQEIFADFLSDQKEISAKLVEKSN